MEASQTFLEVMAALNKRMDQFEGELQKTPPVANTTGTLAADFAAFKSFTAEVMRGFQHQMGLLARNLDNIEMHSRRKILLLHGITEEKQEDTAAVVMRAVTNHLHVKDFSLNDINRCQRMGRATTDKPRPVLVKLKDLDMRNKLWFSKTSLKGTGITLSEFLTRSRHQAFMEARQRVGIAKCWTKDGFIYVIGPDGTRHRICSLIELQNVVPAQVSGTLKPAPAPGSKETTAATSKSRRVAAASSRK